MGIFDKVKEAVSVLTGARQSVSQQQAYLNEIWFNKQTGMMPNQWYRLLNDNGDLTGFGFSCACGMFYQLLNIGDWMGRTHTCQCKHSFSLYKTLGITSDVDHATVQEYFSKLPARPRLSRVKRTPQFIDSGAGAGEVHWAGLKPNIPAGMQ